jgi:hypothetical protein
VCARSDCSTCKVSALCFMSSCLESLFGETETYLTHASNVLMKKASMHVSIWASSLDLIQHGPALFLFTRCLDNWIQGQTGRSMWPFNLGRRYERGENRDGIVYAFTWASRLLDAVLWIPVRVATTVSSEGR